MSNNGNKSVSHSNYNIEKDNNKQKKHLQHKAYSPTINNYKLKLMPSHESDETKNSNITIEKEKEFPYNSYPIKPLDKDDIQNFFISRKQKIFMSPIMHSNKKISFQRQKDKEILEFSLFDDKLIFKDINKAYLQDQYCDDGDESSEETINNGKLHLLQEIEDSIVELKKNLKNNQNKPILSRRMIFKNDDNKE